MNDMRKLIEAIESLDENSLDVEDTDVLMSQIARIYLTDIIEENNGDLRQAIKVAADPNTVDLVAKNLATTFQSFVKSELTSLRQTGKFR